MATTSIAEPIQQAVIRHMVNGDEPFRFILFTDGSGKLVDINYDETLDISHDLDLPSLAARTTLVLTPVRPLTNVDYEQTDLDENEIETDDTPTLFDAISNLFLDCNDSLENPVGDPPEDDEPTVENGTFEDFNKALAAVAYLTSMGLKARFSFQQMRKLSNTMKAITSWPISSQRSQTALTCAAARTNTSTKMTGA
jgi:hypothetical protein